jgi:hypothetical protein
MPKKIPVFISPPNTLKIKVGEGGIPSFILKRVQEYLESNPVDFTPAVIKHLEQLKDLKDQITNKKVDDDTGRTKATNLIMQLKSNGSMFNYHMISMISDVMLRFMENSHELNKDFMDIFAMYTRVLETVITKKLTGNGGREGYALTQELHNACMRYNAKHNIKG